MELWKYQGKYNWLSLLKTAGERTKEIFKSEGQQQTQQLLERNKQSLP